MAWGYVNTWLTGCLLRGPALKIWIMRHVRRRIVENAAFVAVRQFLQRGALRAASGGLFLLLRCEGIGPCGFRGRGRGSFLRLSGCGSNRAPCRRGLRVPRASSVRRWCRGRPTVPPRIGTAPWVHDSLEDAEEVEGLRASPSIVVTVTTSLGPACRVCG